MDLADDFQDDDEELNFDKLQKEHSMASAS